MKFYLDKKESTLLENSFFTEDRTSALLEHIPFGFVTFYQQDFSGIYVYVAQFQNMDDMRLNYPDMQIIFGT